MTPNFFRPTFPAFFWRIISEQWVDFVNEYII